MSFQDDIKGQNTQLFPIVRIGDDWYSTNNITIDGNYCKPILINIPSIRESIDLNSRKFKTSNVTLQFSNFPFEGVRFSDQLSETSLINTEVIVYFKSPSTNTIGDMEEVYKGIIRRISHDDSKVKVDLEDLTEKQNRDLPQVSLGDNLNILDRYKNKPIPMVYGHVDRSPVVIENGYLIPDYKMINGYNTIYSDYCQMGSIISLSSSDSYADVPSKIIRSFGDDIFIRISDTDDDILSYSKGDEQYLAVASPFSFTSAKVINLNINKLMPYNALQVSIKKSPSMVSIIKEAVVDGVYNGGGIIGEDFNPNDENNIGFEILNENQMANISDDDNNTFEEFYPSNYGNNDYFVYSETVVGFSGQSVMAIRLGLSDDGFNMFSQDMGVKLNGIIIKSPILYENLLYQWTDFVNGNYYTNLSPYDPALHDLYDPNFQGQMGNDEIGLFTLDTGQYYMENRDFLISYKVEDASLFDVQQPDYVFDADYTIGGNTTDAFIENALPNGDIEDIAKLFVQSSGDIIIVSEIDVQYSSYRLTYDFRLRSLETFKYGNMRNPFSKKMYVNVNGRINLFNPNINNNSFIQNPIDIIYDLVRSEIGHEDIDNDEYIMAKEQHLLANGSDWKFGFAVDKKINSKKLIEDIAKSTKCFPKFKNDGTFGFSVIKDSYIVASDYNNALTIKESEVISYSFKKTKPEQIYKKVDVQYKKDYATGSYLKRTDSIDAGADDYYGIETSDDAYLEFESPYIRDKDTADELTKFLYAQHKNDHLTFKLKLPLKYINLDVGDLVKFRDLFQGMKAHGIDYRMIQSLNSQYYYPLFMVTSTTKNLDSIDIECIQLHHLSDDAIDSAWQEGLMNLDGSFVEGDETSLFYFPDAIYVTPPEEEEEEEPEVIYGCTDPNADNYNPDATNFDGSCTYTYTLPTFDEWWQETYHVIPPDNLMGSDAVGPMPTSIVGWEYMLLHLSEHMLPYQDEIHDFLAEYPNGGEYRELIEASVAQELNMTVSQVVMMNQLNWFIYEPISNNQGLSNFNLLLNTWFNDAVAFVQEGYSEQAQDDIQYEEYYVKWQDMAKDWYDNLVNPVTGIPYIDGDFTTSLHAVLLTTYKMLIYYVVVGPSYPDEWEVEEEEEEEEGECGTGDVNADGNINVLDVVQAVAHILGNTVLTEDQLCAVDMNQDDVLNVLDIVQLVNGILSD